MISFKIGLSACCLTCCAPCLQVLDVLTSLEDPLSELLDKWSTPELVAYRYPTASAGPQGDSVEEVRIVLRCRYAAQPHQLN